MKTCTKCEQEKPESEFYNRAAAPDGKDYYCKPCRAQASVMYQTRRTVDPLTPTAGSTAQVQQLLASRGIPTVAGRAAGMPYIDLVAWGCVPVEAKGSNLLTNNCHHWTFSQHVRDDGIDGVFVFLAWFPGEKLRAFVVPSSESWLFDKQGRPKLAALHVTIGSTHHLSSTWQHLRWYENAFHHVEQYRQKYSARLVSQTKPLRMAASQLKMAI